MKVFGYILLFANIAVLFSSSWLAVGIIGLIDFIWLAMAAKPAPLSKKDDDSTSPVFADDDLSDSYLITSLWNKDRY